MHRSLMKFLGPIILGYLVALYIPSFGMAIFPFMKVWLFGLFFLTCLKIKTREIINLKGEKSFIILVALMRLLLVPLVIYIVSGVLVPQYQIPLTLLSLVPVAETSTLITGLLGGKASLTLAVTTITSLLSPFWIPIFMKLFMQQKSDLSWEHMTADLVIVLILPLIISELLQLFLPKVTAGILKFQHQGTLLCIFLLFTGSFASHLDHVKQIDIITFIGIILTLSLLFIALGLLGWGIAIYRRKDEEIAVITSFLLMNSALALYLGLKVFPDNPEVTTTLVLTFVPWNVSYIIFGGLLGTLQKAKR